MGKNQCDRCMKCFTTKSNRNRHQNSKKCIALVIPETDKEKCECPNCQITFSCSSDLNKHFEPCRTQYLIKNTELTSLQNRFKDSKEDFVINDKKANADTNLKADTSNNNSNSDKKTMNNISHTVINNITNFNADRIQINLSLSAFSTDDEPEFEAPVDQLRFYKNIFKMGLLCIPEFVKKLHCSDEFSDKCNIYISNLRHNEINIFDENEWKVRRCKEILEQLIEDKHYTLLTYFNDLNHRFISETDCKKFEKYVKKFDENDPKFREWICQELKHVLYDNKNKAKRIKSHQKM